VALFNLVGPHFGDRHGITDALVNAMRAADIHPRAMKLRGPFHLRGGPEADLDRTLHAIAGPSMFPPEIPV